MIATLTFDVVSGFTEVNTAVSTFVING